MGRGAAPSHKQTILEVSYLGLSLLGSWLILRWALKQMDPNRNAKALAKERKKELARRLGRPINLDGAYEDVVAQAVINPRCIDVTLQDVGGLDHIIDDVMRNVITPMRHPNYFHSSLLRQKRGVLLYGPPGTGKTMLAKALAKECDACFILLKSSTILSKWYGDSNKLVAAVWSLAQKLQPTILFIDEVDSLLGQRSSQEHEATTAIKTEFMQLWEGFETTNANILVLGATNKKDRLDDAVLRRFSLQYEVQLPNTRQREAILRLTLRRHALETGPEMVDRELWPLIFKDSADRDLISSMYPSATELFAAADAAQEADAAASGSVAAAEDPAAGCAAAAAEAPAPGEEAQAAGEEAAGGEAAAQEAAPPANTLAWLAQQTEGFSGSDLVQLCSQAAAVPIQETIERRNRQRQLSQAGSGPRRSLDAPELQPRSLSRADFTLVLEQFTPPSRAAQEARRRVAAAAAAAAGGAHHGHGNGEGVVIDYNAVAAAVLRNLPNVLIAPPNGGHDE